MNEIAKKNRQIPEGFFEEKLNKKEDWRGARCVYCPNLHTTSDHVPPKNLFATVEITHPFLTAPCCKSCNTKFSVDDDHFRNIVVEFCKDKSEIAKTLADGEVMVSQQRNPKIAKKEVSRKVIVDKFSESGFYLGKFEDPLSFSDEEISCIHRMADRIARLMHWRIAKRPAPLSSRVNFVEPQKMKGDKIYNDIVKGLFQNGPWTSGNPDVYKLYAMPVGRGKHLWAFYGLIFGKFPMHFFFGPQTHYFIDDKSGLILSARD